MLQVQESAVHNLEYVDNLIASVKLNKKRECILSIDALKGLFVEILMPKDRALRSFHQHPFEYLEKLSNDAKLRSMRLLLWYFESLLKAKFNNFLKSLQVIEFTLKKRINKLFNLIVNKFLKARFPRHSFNYKIQSSLVFIRLVGS
jgi:ribosome biogenesis protein MAK21